MQEHSVRARRGRPIVEIRRLRWGHAVAFGFGITLAGGGLLSACSAKSNPVGPNGECFLATDCAPGLVCIEQPNKTRICSDDLSRVTGRAPDDGAEPEDNEEAGADGARPDGTTPRDSGNNDTGTTQPDTGTPPEEDAGDQ